MRFDAAYHEPTLVHSLREGSQKAFEVLYNRFAPPLLGSISRLVHDQQQAEDLLQDSFLTIWRHLDQYDPAKGRLYTWMWRIARNLTLDYLHAARRQAHQRLDELPLEALGSVTPTYHAIGLRYWVSSTLGTKHSQLIELVYFQGYTHQEVSNECGIPLGTVKTGIRQALQGLRNAEHKAAGLFLY